VTNSYESSRPIRAGINSILILLITLTTTRDRRPSTLERKSVWAKFDSVTSVVATNVAKCKPAMFRSRVGAYASIKRRFCRPSVRFRSPTCCSERTDRWDRIWWRKTSNAAGTWEYRLTTTSGRCAGCRKP